MKFSAKPLAKAPVLLLMFLPMLFSLATSRLSYPAATGTFLRPQADTVCFQRDILPLFRRSCAYSPCHDSKTRTEGYDFSTYTGIKKGVRAFNPAGSPIMPLITTTNAQKRMPPPPADSMSAEEIALISLWIQQGALQTTCPEPAGVNDPSGTVSSLAAMPNPASTQTSVQFGLRRESGIHLSVLDELGRTVAVPADGRYQAGIQTIRWDCSRVPAGNYTVVLATDSYTTVIRVAVVR